ncbi:response regulator transcription factor [Lapillicoccus sp.]|uniref:response regulator n=1 Tax=Lapillicoccus sp. TaxID=1909287 RepID=UPI0025ED7DE4|nr:response regulator transcription factor [Lapillicoccus sp.]
MKHRVVVVDDQPLVRGGITQILNRSTDIEVVGEASDGRQAIDVVRRLRPDVVMMDLRMPRLDGVAATAAITGDPAVPVRVLVLTTFDDDELVIAAIRAGASGFLLKDAEPEELRNAVRVVARGDALLSPAVTSAVLHQVRSPTGEPADVSRLEALTEREVEVLLEVGRGLANDEIAATLHLSSATVRTYVSRILTKTGSRDRAQLVVLAYETRLVAVDPPQ